MTACTNNGGKARRVVTAALVGVLSVGAVPAIALATGTGDVSLQFAESGSQLSNGTATPTFAYDADGNGTYETGERGSQDAEGNWSVTTEHLPLQVSVSSIQIPGASGSMQVNPDTIHDYKIQVFRADEDGNATGGALSGNKVSAAGEYVVVVSALDGDYEGQTFKTNFVVNGMKLPAAATAFENGDTGDTALHFTGSELDVDFFETGNTSNTLIEGVDYTVTYTKDGQAVSSVKGEGDYVANLTGIGKYVGSSASYHFTVYAVDLSNCTIVTAPFTDKTGAPAHPERVYFNDGQGHITDLDTSLVNLTPQTDVTAVGTYTFDVSIDAATAAAGNVFFGSAINKTVSVEKVDALATFQYDGAALEERYDVDGSAAGAFDTRFITAYAGDTKVNPTVTVTLAEAAPGVSYRGSRNGGNYTPDLNAGKAGVYTVTAEVARRTVDGHVYAGAETFTVKVYKGSIDADSALYVYTTADAATSTPVAVTSYAKGFDGDELTGAFFTVAGKGVSDTDFTKQIVDSEGNVVDAAVDAGDYGLVVTSDWYLLSGETTLPITIGKVDLDSLSVGEIVKWNGVAGEEYLRPTGQAVNGSVFAINSLGLAYDTGNEADETDGSDDYKGLDLIPYCVDVVVEYDDNGTWKEVGAIDRDGTYRVTVTVADEIASNFTFADGQTSKTVEFTTSAKGYFKDVQPSDWYFYEVQQAFNAGYMNGTTAPTLDDSTTNYKNEFKSGTFSPKSILTRGEVACVLYNMSGDDVDETDASYDENTGWKTGYSDMTGKEFYAEAAYWAKQNGVVNGYADGSFGGDNQITREEFACMLANFAEKVLRDSDVAADNSAALEAMPDADSVSDWAEGPVAWAVSKKVMGNDGRVSPTAKMDRGTCASIIMNYMDPDDNVPTAVLTRQQRG